MTIHFFRAGLVGLCSSDKTWPVWWLWFGIPRRNRVWGRKGDGLTREWGLGPLVLFGRCFYG